LLEIREQADQTHHPDQPDQRAGQCEGQIPGRHIVFRDGLAVTAARPVDDEGGDKGQHCEADCPHSGDDGIGASPHCHEQA